MVMDRKVEFSRYAPRERYCSSRTFDERLVREVAFPIRLFSNLESNTCFIPRVSLMVSTLKTNVVVLIDVLMSRGPVMDERRATAAFQSELHHVKSIGTSWEASCSHIRTPSTHVASFKLLRDNPCLP